MYHLEKSLQVFLVVIVLLYLGLLLINPQLGPSDEYAFLPTLQSGKFFPRYGEDFPYYNSAQLGRFGPLGGQEYNLVALVTNHPVGYFALNALELVLFIAALLVVIRAVSKNAALNYAAAALLLLAPAVTNTFFKLLYVEKNVATLLAVFLAGYVIFTVRQWWWLFATALIAANLAIYYKEPVFVAVGAFSAGHLLFTWRSAPWRQKFLDAALIASSLVFLLIYTLVVLPDKAQAIPSGYNTSDAAITFAKTLFNYGAISDPVLLVLVLPLTGWRMYQVFLRGHAPLPLVDPMLGAAAAYVGVLLALNLYSPYYMLPAYAFAVPAVCHFLAERKLATRAWNIMVGVAISLFVINSVPMGLHYLSYNKYLPVNFNRTIDFLVQDIERRYAGRRIAIFFEGVDRGTGRGVYFIVGEFLRYKGLPITKFDFRTTLEATEPVPFVGRRSPFDTDETIRAVDPDGQLVHADFPFTVFQPGPLSASEPGDIVVVSPHSTARLREEDWVRLAQQYVLVFQTESSLAVPNFTLKTLLKYAIVNWTPFGERGSRLVASQNVFDWPDYYVYIKK